ncbi:hypothetical protein KG088_16920 [Halomonas sp. TRM85114]|uniref:hypothetical protein n=1 Tax=Halomonas jincaotanensis TaxID=2810616 RepID=UPI001BD2CC5F|nr:hypothetical protein [Halomonas jincaotanensis]MBS9405300.1 hypothetical protein [Halomonas jincaotanensis]
MVPFLAGPQATFITGLRLPQIEDPAEVDIALIGLPWDSGSTNRVGTPEVGGFTTRASPP